MGIFKKKERSLDTLDFTMLQKRGILQKISAGERNLQQTSSRVSSLDSSGNASSDIFGALDSLSRASSSEAIDSIKRFQDTSIDEISSLKVKVDDLEFKLERLLEKIQYLENKLLCLITIHSPAQ